MTHEILPLAIALLAALFWVIFVAWLMARWLGIVYPLNPFKSRNVHLSFGQSNCFLDVFTFGTSMVIFDLTDRFVRWKIYGNPLDRPDGQQVVSAIIGGLFVGFFFGLFNAIYPPRRVSGATHGEQRPR